MASEKQNLERETLAEIYSVCQGRSLRRRLYLSLIWKI